MGLLFPLIATWLIIATSTVDAHAGSQHGSRFAYSSCGSSRYDPSVDFCCGVTVVPTMRRDLICCNGFVINNPDGVLQCCATRSFDPRRERCVNNDVIGNNVDRTVFQRPPQRLDGSVASGFVGARPKGFGDQQGFVGREIEIPADPNRRATGRDVYGQDILNCNGKIHRLTDPSQYGYFSCCGEDAYNWLYYACINNQVVTGQDPYRLNYYASEKAVDGAPLALVDDYLPYCEDNKLVGSGGSLAYACCGNALYSTKTHFCCGSDIHERKSGQLCCNGVYSDNRSGFISCCNRTPYDIRTYVCQRDEEN